MTRRTKVIAAVAVAVMIAGYAIGVRYWYSLPVDCSVSCDQWQTVRLYKSDPLFDALPAAGGRVVSEYTGTNHEIEDGSSPSGPPFASVSTTYAMPGVTPIDDLLPAFDRAATAAGWRPWGPGRTGTNYCKQNGDRAAFATLRTNARTPPYRFVLTLTGAAVAGTMSYCTPPPSN